MKLFITIPAYNEAATISRVIKALPKKIVGTKTVKILVWNDGSTDQTATIASKAGADYVFSSKRNLGLARTFDLVTAKAVELGADIIVNIDADDQYDPDEIPLLIKPILDDQADIVNGDRQINNLKHMPTAKKYGNLLGSYIIRKLTGLEINDASSGFRAYTASAINQLFIFSRHTYTHETLIQAAFGGLTVAEVPITFRARIGSAGGSRLISSVLSHIIKSGSTIVRTILMYRAFKFLVTMGALELLASLLLGIRYIYFVFFLNQAGGHVQSLILASMLLTLGVTTIMVGLLADLIAINRRLYTKVNN